jgi:hypothetical protein
MRAPCHHNGIPNRQSIDQLSYTGVITLFGLLPRSVMLVVVAPQPFPSMVSGVCIVGPIMIPLALI